MTSRSVTERDRNVAYKPPWECLACGAHIGGRRRGYCSGRCRQSAYRARLRGDPQALFDRWCVLLDAVCRYGRAHNAAQDIEHTLWCTHKINPHAAVEWIAGESARRRREREAAR